MENNKHWEARNIKSRYKVKNIKKCYKNSVRWTEFDEIRVKNAEKICNELLKRGIEELDEDQHDQFKFSLTENFEDEELNEIVTYIIQPYIGYETYISQGEEANE